MDALARRGTRFDRAYATAPITLTSHASIMSGRYPAGHGARHNGIRVDSSTPLLAELVARSGFATGAFVAAFPLDRRFGLDRGFQTYGDRMPRVAGKLFNERHGREVVDEALAWLERNRTNRFFLWVHLFEPHAPYGLPRLASPVQQRYDYEVEEADHQVGRLLEGLGTARESTMIVVTGDHGEAFGEHGEITHSLFVYDTTLRVPLIIGGLGFTARVSSTPVSLIDVAPTIAGLLGVTGMDADGIDLRPALGGDAVPERTLYAESFAPLLDFGWSPLRSVRTSGWKFIDAPRPELYQTSGDADETRDLAASEPQRVAAMRADVSRYSPATMDAKVVDRDAQSRLQSLGYVGGGSRAAANRADPKDRRELAADIARATSGDLIGPELEAVLRRILAVDPRNPQVNMRLGFVRGEAGHCPEALKYFEAAIASGIPGADVYLGIAACHARWKQFDEAARALREGDRVEPGNPVVLANLGIVLSDGGRPAEGVPALQKALAIDPDFHEARFNLAIAYARMGNRADAAREAAYLLRRLPADAPQRPEVDRLLKAVQ